MEEDKQYKTASNLRSEEFDVEHTLYCKVAGEVPSFHLSEHAKWDFVIHNSWFKHLSDFPLNFNWMIMAPRWKGKAAAIKALAEPMSEVVSRLQSSLIDSNSQGMLARLNVLLAVRPEQTELLHHACFGRPIVSAEKDDQWFLLSLEESLYLYYMMRCIKIVDENACTKNDEDLWQYMTTMGDSFALLFIAYSHLRAKNWVVRPGAQYGVDFVAYRHHPALVHSEYAVLVSSEGDGNTNNNRLRVWSDFHCTLRLCGSVAKTLLVLHISSNRNADVSPWSLEHYQIEERIITRWNPEHSRENQTLVQKET